MMNMAAKSANRSPKLGLVIGSTLNHLILIGGHVFVKLPAVKNMTYPDNVSTDSLRTVATGLSLRTALGNTQ